jgi:succinate-semialdehyde dehydrogenase/glutarate-semialdehyde dehydrogenase
MSADTLPADASSGTPSYAVDPSLVRRLARRVAAGRDPELITTTAPFTGGRLAELPVSTLEDVARAYDEARAAQHAWAARPVRERARVLLAFHDLLVARQGEALDLVQWESGKARRHAFEEIAHCLVVARYYARTAARELSPKRRAGIYPLLTSVRELRHPKGVVGIVEPWNYPLSIPATDTMAALVAGNGVVIKPDTQTAVTMLWAADLFAEAGLPEGLLQVVVGDGPTIGGAVVDGADFVCFTGSTETGRSVAQRAAARLVGASLELGGKNAAVVLADADPERTAEGLARACFSTAGQLCVSMERIYLVGAASGAVLDRFVERVKTMRLGTDFAY